MVIAVDFDGTIVSQDRSYGDLSSPLEFMPYAKEGLQALKRAGHIIVLYSARANRAILVDPELDPLVRAKKKVVNKERWQNALALNKARYEQMVSFVQEHLSEEIDAIDDGLQGKPQAAIFIDDRALRFGSIMGGHGWKAIADKYGMVEDGQQD